jgi:pre-mRNA-splicing factor SYF1
MELKIANAQVIVNYAQFLEENKYYEESFKVRSLAPLRWVHR